MMENSKEFYENVNSMCSGNEDSQFCEFTFLPSDLYTANVIRNTHGSMYETILEHQILKHKLIK